MLRLIPQSEFIEGRWRNGQGVSWEIASSTKPGAVDFSWRFAKARIDNDVPFSIYPSMDRIFMMLGGGGMDLEFATGEVLHVHKPFVPHQFSCDVPLNCKLLGGPSMDLNLFVARMELRLVCEVLTIHGIQNLKVASAATVFFSLIGTVIIAGHVLQQGDAALVTNQDEIEFSSPDAKLYVGHLSWI